nr:PhzF family phenazine biosynthesis protein [uncultured Carboxylicivirga sp.]
MRIPFYQVDAFTNELFKGNPAGVCFVDEYPEDNIMQKIATENNLAETAFVKKVNEDQFFIRWFTPVSEVELCGHATLASAFILFDKLEYQKEKVLFNTLYSGILTVQKEDDWLWMDFPADDIQTAEITDELKAAFPLRPDSVLKGKTDYVLVYSLQKQVEEAMPDLQKLAKVNARGVIVTSKGDSVDFVSRFFAPQIGVDEDPVTGSAHTSLTPYWSKALEKKELNALQLSQRGGVIKCIYQGDRVLIGGQACLYLEGSIQI